jgi:hypothetical protein
MVGKARETSKTPSGRIATTQGPPASGRQARPASAPAVPSFGNVAVASRTSAAKRTSREHDCRGAAFVDRLRQA